MDSGRLTWADELKIALLGGVLNRLKKPELKKHKAVSRAFSENLAVFLEKCA